MKYAYLTDSGTGFHPNDYIEANIECLPLQLIDNGITYNDMVELSKSECINILKQEHVFTTSQPNYGITYNTILDMKTSGVEFIYAIPICNGLSGTISSIESICRELNINLKVYDCYVTAIVQDYLIRKVKEMVENNIDNNNIDDFVNKTIDSTNTILIPNDLKHLKRGGRLTPIAYNIAEILKIVPLLKINKETEGKIDVLAKVRTYQKAFDKTLEIMKKEIGEDKYLITIAHADALNKANKAMDIIKRIFPNSKVQVIELCNVVTAHTGLDCIAIQYFKLV